MDWILQSFGRFHPLLVHLPIGIIVLAFIFDALSLTHRFRRLRVAVQPSLALGTLSAVVSLLTGLILSEEGGYAKPLLQYHQYAGIATTLFLFVLLMARRNKRILTLERTTKKPVRFWMFIPVMALLIFTGHWGGSLTHGEEFLTEPVVTRNAKKEDPLMRIQKISKPEQAVLYSDVVQPILESKCYSCHSAARQKGDLRLDEKDFILAGGKEGHVISGGAADSSSLFSRLMLPIEHDDHMPPGEKPQPSAAEIDIIRLWINEGAPFETKVAALKEAEKAVQFISLIAQANEQESWLPAAEISPPDEAAVQRAKNAGVVILPVGEESQYLQASFTNIRTLSPQTLQLLDGLDEHIVSIRFSYCVLTPNDLSFLNRFKNLTWLYLDHTNVDNNSFTNVKTLPNLRYLNIVFTGISEQSLDAKRFPSLQKLYTFKSQVNSKGIMRLKTMLRELKIDTGGFTLPALESDTIIYRRKS